MMMMMMMMIVNWHMTAMKLD